MDKIKVIYLTDDRSNYVGGYYYLDWLNVFEKHAHLIKWGPSYPLPKQEDFNSADLIVIGHGGHDLLMREHVAKWYFKLGKSVGLGRTDWDKRLKKAKLPKILMSKNDYKDIDEKSSLAKELGIDLLITHTKAAVDEFHKFGVKAEWIPFGVDLTLFRPLAIKKDIDIGFIGNLQDQWNGGSRRALIEVARRKCTDLVLDIRSNENCEGFLVGEEYAYWTGRCHLALNTVSAWGTVGPKWFEQMACATIPVGPENEYEGLLRPDMHYVSVKPDLSNFREKIDLFYNNSDYREMLLSETNAMAQMAGMDCRYRRLMDILSDLSMP